MNQRQLPPTALLLLACLAAALAAATSPAAAHGQRPVDALRQVYLDVPDGRIVIELNPDFAPLQVEQFIKFVRSGFYDDATFYRVIDGFVAQAGDGSDMAGEFSNPQVKGEFERPLEGLGTFTLVQSGDLFAPETGFIDGFAVGRDPATGAAWLTHCPGVVAMARNNGRDTASTDFYIVIGQAPRYLDRNLTIFGRVIRGMEIVQRIRRDGPDEDGMIEDPNERTPIDRARLAADLPPSERMKIHVPDTASAEFKQMLDERRNRSDAFFHHEPPAVLDVCQVPLRTTVEGRPSGDQ